MKHLVISFVSPDRPGLVESLSNIIKKYHGNWQASSMHHLSNYFAGVIEVAIAADKSAELITAIKSINDIETIIKESEQLENNKNAAVVLELTANDRAGIVQEISSTIHQQNGNLLKLVSRKESAPHCGQTLFKAKATIDVDETNTDNLIDALENLADDLMVDISR